MTNEKFNFLENRYLNFNDEEALEFAKKKVAKINELSRLSSFGTKEELNKLTQAEYDAVISMRKMKKALGIPSYLY